MSGRVSIVGVRDLVVGGLLGSSSLVVFLQGCGE